MACLQLPNLPSFLYSPTPLKPCFFYVFLVLHSISIKEDANGTSFVDEWKSQRKHVHTLAKEVHILVQTYFMWTWINTP